VSAKPLQAVFKKITTPRRRASQNHPIRTNRSPGTFFVPHRAAPGVRAPHNPDSGPQAFFSSSDKILSASQAQHANLRNFNTCTNCVRNSRRISTSVLQDLKLLRISTYRNKTLSQQNFRVPLWSSQARPMKPLSTNTHTNCARNSRRISTYILQDLKLLRISTYRNNNRAHRCERDFVAQVVPPVFLLGGRPEAFLSWTLRAAFTATTKPRRMCTCRKRGEGWGWPANSRSLGRRGDLVMTARGWQGGCIVPQHGAEKNRVRETNTVAHRRDKRR
jgi:hypothetical protein